MQDCCVWRSAFISGSEWYTGKTESACQDKCQYDLYYQYHRYARHKVPVLRFMPEQQHAGINADAAAYERRKEKRFFRNSPQTFTGFVLVRCHEHKARKI